MYTRVCSARCSVCAIVGMCVRVYLYQITAQIFMPIILYNRCNSILQKDLPVLLPSFGPCANLHHNRSLSSAGKYGACTIEQQKWCKKKTATPLVLGDRNEIESKSNRKWTIEQ